MLTETETSIICSLLRIYFTEMNMSEESYEEMPAASKKNHKIMKYFRNNKENSAKDMLFNLYLTYIESISNKN